MSRKKIPLNRPTIGADPEFFIKPATSDFPYPVCGLLGGTKERPRMIDGYGAQEDNVMCEFNIPPSTTSGEFARHIRAGVETILATLNREHENLAPFTAWSTSSWLFPESQLGFKQAHVFGCSPDFSGYDMGNPQPRILPEQLTIPGSGAWRFSGGHVHLGYKHLLKTDVPDYVAAQFADVYLGLSSLGIDAQGERRKFYGTPARYRPTKYGIEYRTLSNQWIFSLDTADMVGYHALQLCNFLSKPDKFLKNAWAEIPWVDVARAIQTEDTQLASQLRHYCTRFGLEML
jgi:hypothetical protein